MLKKAKHYYLIGALINAASTAIIVLLWRDSANAHLYLSHVTASSFQSYTIMLLANVSYVTLMCFFLERFFFDHIHASKLLRLNFYLVIVTILVVAIFPIVSGFSGMIHENFSNLSLVFGIGIYIQLCLNKYISLKNRITIAGLVVLGLSLKVVLIPIAWQLSLIAIGELSILLVAYSKPRTSS